MVRAQWRPSEANEISVVVYRYARRKSRKLHDRGHQCGVLSRRSPKNKEKTVYLTLII